MHLAGAVGAALAKHCLAEGWLLRHRDSRAVALTPKGRRALAERFSIDISPRLQSRDHNG